MGCNCGRRAGGVRRTVTGAAGDSATVQRAGAARTRVRFYAVPAPEDEATDELVFDTLYQARAEVAAREGWRVEARRGPIDG